MTNLKKVNLSSCFNLIQIILANLDTVNFTGCTNLLKVILQNCALADISFLNQMTEIFYLDLYKCPVEDISVLENLTKLKHVDLSFCKVKDLSALINNSKNGGIGNIAGDIIYLEGNPADISWIDDEETQYNTQLSELSTLVSVKLNHDI